MRAALVALSFSLVAAIASSAARAQMTQCWATAPVDLGGVDARAIEAVASTNGADGGLVVIRRARGALEAITLTSQRATPGPPTASAAVPLAVDPNEHLVDLLLVRDVYVLRTVGVCPNTGRSFHKCVHLRVLGADGAQRGATYDEDVVEWSGVGTAAVVGDRLVTIRTPMYDGAPAFAAYRLSAAGDAIVRDGAVTRLGGDARPEARVVIGVNGAGWAALITSSIGEVPPLLVTANGEHAVPVPRVSTDLVAERASLEPDGTLAVLFDGHVARIAPDGSLRERVHAGTRGADLPASLSAEAPQFVLRTTRGHVLVVNPDAPREERPYATLGPSSAFAPLVAGAVGPRSIVVLFARSGRATKAQAVMLTCGAVYQH